MKKLVLGTLVSMGLLQFVQMNQAHADDCQAASGYCLSVGGMTNQAGTILYGTMLSTPLSKSVYMSVPNDVQIMVPANGSDVMVQQGNVQIAAGVVEGKTNNNYATYNLKLNDGVSMKSSVTNKGNKISCSVNALGFIVRYKTPVVQVTTQVQSANDTININSVVDVGEASESALAGIFCKNGTFEVQWGN